MFGRKIWTFTLHRPSCAVLFAVELRAARANDVALTLNIPLRVDEIFFSLCWARELSQVRHWYGSHAVQSLGYNEGENFKVRIIKWTTMKSGEECRIMMIMSLVRKVCLLFFRESKLCISSSLLINAQQVIKRGFGANHYRHGSKPKSRVICCLLRSLEPNRPLNDFFLHFIRRKITFGGISLSFND